MLIKSISGKDIYQSGQKTVRAALEEGVAKGVDFSCADLRRARLCGASLDGMVAVNATFWGADLDGADIGLADLRKTDMRCANLKDACLAETDLSGANLHGAYFSGMIIEGAVLDGVKISCPSFWDMDLGGVHSIREAVFSHNGEEDIVIDPARWLLHGREGRIVLNGPACIWRGKTHHASLPVSLRKELEFLQASIEKHLKADSSQTASGPIPKRAGFAKHI